MAEMNGTKEIDKSLQAEADKPTKLDASGAGYASGKEPMQEGTPAYTTPPESAQNLETKQAFREAAFRMQQQIKERQAAMTPEQRYADLETGKVQAMNLRPLAQRVAERPPEDGISDVRRMQLGMTPQSEASKLRQSGSVEFGPTTSRGTTVTPTNVQQTSTGRVIPPQMAAQSPTQAGQDNRPVVRQTPTAGAARPVNGVSSLAPLGGIVNPKTGKVTAQTGLTGVFAEQQQQQALDQTAKDFKESRAIALKLSPTDPNYDAAWKKSIDHERVGRQLEEAIHGNDKTWLSGRIENLQKGIDNPNLPDQWKVFAHEKIQKYSDMLRKTNVAENKDTLAIERYANDLMNTQIADWNDALRGSADPRTYMQAIKAFEQHENGWLKSGVRQETIESKKNALLTKLDEIKGLNFRKSIQQFETKRMGDRKFNLEDNATGITATSHQEAGSHALGDVIEKIKQEDPNADKYADAISKKTDSELSSYQRSIGEAYNDAMYRKQGIDKQIEEDKVLLKHFEDSNKWASDSIKAMLTGGTTPENARKRMELIREKMMVGDRYGEGSHIVELTKELYKLDDEMAKLEKSKEDPSVIASGDAASKEIDRRIADSNKTKRIIQARIMSVKAEAEMARKNLSPAEASARRIRDIDKVNPTYNAQETRRTEASNDWKYIVQGARAMIDTFGDISKGSFDSQQAKEAWGQATTESGKQYMNKFRNIIKVVSEMDVDKAMRQTKLDRDEIEDLKTIAKLIQ